MSPTSYQTAPPCDARLPRSVLQMSSAPAERSTSQGGFAAHPPPLRSGGLLLPPGPPFSPLVARSWRSVPRARRGFAAHPPPLRFGGLLLPPGPPCRGAQLLDGEGVGLREDEGVGLGEAASWSTLARAASSWPAVAKSPLPSACW